MSITALNYALYTKKPYSSDRSLTYSKSPRFIEFKTYKSLRRAWIGFRIAYRKGNQEKMNYYAEGINKFERQLGRTVSSSSDILKVVQQESHKKKEQTIDVHS